MLINDIKIQEIHQKICFRFKINVKIGNQYDKKNFKENDKCMNGVKVELKNHVLTIRGKGELNKNHSSVDLELDCSGDGQWYLENRDTVVTHIADGQTAVYRND